MRFRIGNKILNYVAGSPEPPHPIVPPNTVRVRTNDGNVPIRGSGTSYDTATLVPGTTNVYDVYKSGTSFNKLLKNSYNVVEVLGANTTDITNMNSMFFNCDYITSVQLFDTSSVTDMYSMFYQCKSLNSVPLFDTSSVTDMRDMFVNCFNVESGALALYQRASSQANPPQLYDDAFLSCGYSTTTGRLELQQIPSSWGGLG